MAHPADTPAQSWAIRQFSASEDPQAAEQCCVTVAQAMGTDANNELFCADRSKHQFRWHAIAANSLKRTPALRMLHAVEPACEAVAFAYLYPEEEAPEGAPEPQGIVDISPYTRPEALPVRDELLAYLHTKTDEFLQAHGPFLYLKFLATRSSSQGRGLGSRLLQHLAARADALGRYMYLEATSEDNRRLYARHGFQDLEQKAWSLPSLPDSSVKLFLMARPPRQPPAGAGDAAGAQQP